MSVSSRGKRRHQTTDEPQTGSCTWWVIGILHTSHPGRSRGRVLRLRWSASGLLSQASSLVSFGCARAYRAADAVRRPRAETPQVSSEDSLLLQEQQSGLSRWERRTPGGTP